jgi:F-type H+-transporting ATPase subunit delta
VSPIGSAKRYAQAVFQIAIEKNEIDKWRSELDSIALALNDPQLKAILEDPKIRFVSKSQLVNKCLPDLSELAYNFAYLLIEKQRLHLLDQIVADFNRMADDYQGIGHARVITAIDLDSSDKDRLAKHLNSLTGKQVTVETDVDESIIGGFIARIGDRLLDGSTRARLEALKKKLVESR